MIDLHCHILPGVDDGAPDLEGALAIARCLVDAGFTGVAASPHFGAGPGGDVPIAIATRERDDLQQRLAEEGIALELMPSAEHYVTPELFERLANQDVAPINDGHWLLVELPWGGLADPEGVLFRIQTKGYRLLLAHPERLPELSFDLIARLVERGVKMQLNIASFANIYGNTIHLRALEMADRGLAHVLCTDLHGAEEADLWIRHGLRAISDRYGKRAVQLGTTDNPQAIVDDRPGADLQPITVAR